MGNALRLAPLLHGRGRVDVDHDVGVLRLGHVDGRLHLLEGVFGDIERIVKGRDSTAAHDLDLAGAHAQRLAGALDRLWHAVGEQRVSDPLLIVQRGSWILKHIVRAAEVAAMPRRLANIRARGIGARALGQTRIRLRRPRRREAASCRKRICRS
jgi:hypothetical protein